MNIVAGILVTSSFFSSKKEKQLHFRYLMQHGSRTEDPVNPIFIEYKYING